MDKSVQQVAGKAMVIAIRKMIDAHPLGMIFNSIAEAMDEVSNEEAKAKLTTALDQLQERIAYLEGYSEEISYEFSAGMDDSAMDKFITSLNEYDIPMDAADFWKDMDGISIHLPEGEGLSEYEISKVGKKLDEILRAIDPDLRVIGAYRIEGQDEDVEVRI